MTRKASSIPLVALKIENPKNPMILEPIIVPSTSSRILLTSSFLNDTRQLVD